VTNAQATANVDQLLAGNRGGVLTTPNYNAKLDYGTFITGTSGYTWRTAATYSAGAWLYDPNYQAPWLVPAMGSTSVDAVRVTAGIDNPTIFARLLGINTIPVSAKAASALTGGDSSTIPYGPTWPMTRCAYSGNAPPSGDGICNPTEFWSSNGTPGCDSGSTFKNLIQLGEHQGETYERAHEQLLTQFDTRPGIADQSNSQNSPCIYLGLWSPAGNCTDPGQNSSYGKMCCTRSSNVMDVDVPNYVMSDFYGRIDLNTDWHSAHPSYFPS